jgi:glycosyltransferase involved in cell wall biosynthesis
VTPSSLVTHHESQSTTTALYHVIFERARRVFVETWSELDSPAPGSLPAALPRIVYFDDYLPRPASGSGLSRAQELLEELTALGYWVQVVVWGDLFDLNPALAARGVQRVVHVEHLAIGPPPAAVIVSRPNNFDRAIACAAQWPGAPVIYDAEARFAARIETRLLLEEEGAGDRDRLVAEQKRLEELEASIASRADMILTISADEAAWFELRGARHVRVRDPFPERCAASPRGFSERRDVLFEAGWLSGAASPNGDGLVWMASEVLPLVAARVRSVAVLVTGADPPEELVALESPQLRFVGELADLAEALDSVRVAVVPIRYGSGVKLKAIDALSHAVPVVTTTIGAEGIGEPWRGGMVVEDEPDRFALALARVLHDEEMWNDLRAPLLEACAAHRSDRGALWKQVLAEAATLRATEEGR